MPEGFTDKPALDPRGRAPLWLVLGLALVCLFLASCVDAQAVRQAQQNIRINRAHEADDKLPQEARAIAQDNGDAWEAQLYLLDGTEPSDDARARSSARTGE